MEKPTHLVCINTSDLCILFQDKYLVSQKLVSFFCHVRNTGIFPSSKIENNVFVTSGPYRHYRV